MIRSPGRPANYSPTNPNDARIQHLNLPFLRWSRIRFWQNKIAFTRRFTPTAQVFSPLAIDIFSVCCTTSTEIGDEKENAFFVVWSFRCGWKITMQLRVNPDLSVISIVVSTANGNKQKKKQFKEKSSIVCRCVGIFFTFFSCTFFARYSAVARNFAFHLKYHKSLQLHSGISLGDARACAHISFFILGARCAFTRCTSRCNFNFVEIQQKRGGEQKLHRRK